VRTSNPADDGWEPLMRRDAPVDVVTFSGNGKDADLSIQLSDGRTVTLGVGSVAVTAEGHVDVSISPLGDPFVEVKFSGADLVAREVQVRFDSPYENDQEEFRKKVRKWTARGLKGEFDWGVDAKVLLAQAGQPIADDARLGRLNSRSLVGLASPKPVASST
jgi:hypothetical protein